MVKMVRFALLHGFAVAHVTGATSAAVAQAPLAPSNPQQERCIEAFAETKQEKAIREAMGEPPADVDSFEKAHAWTMKRAIAVFGSVKAAGAIGEKAQRAKYTRRLELLRKSAQEGHLPSLYLLVTWPMREKRVEGIQGVPTARERHAAFRTLHDHRFPLAARMMAGECVKALPRSSEEKPSKSETCASEHSRVESAAELQAFADALAACEKAREVREAEEARRLAEIAVKRETCVDLLREGGFRGDEVAWEELAQYDTSTGANPVGIVPPVEHYAWLELEQLALREFDEYLGGEDSVPRSHQQDLVEDFLNDEQRRDALALAAKYAEIIWPRRILSDTDARDCRLIPQFAGDPEPYGSDPSPR